MKKLGGLALLLTACAPEAFVLVPPPPAAGAQTAIVSVAQGDEVSLTAYEIENELPPIARDIDFGAGLVAVTVLLYDAPIEALGLTPGRVTTATSGRALPEPASIQHVDVTADGPTGDWQARDSLPRALAEVRLPQLTSTIQCTQLGMAQVFNLNAVTDGKLAVPLTDSEALIGVSGGKMYRVSADSVQQLTVTPTISVISAGFVDEDDTIWIGGHRGKLWRATVEGDVIRLEAASRRPTDFSYSDLDGGGSGASVDMFAVNSNGRVYHLDRDGWAEAHDFAGTSKDGAVAWVRPNEAVVTWPLDLGVTRIKDGVAQRETTPAPEGLLSVEHIPGLGTVAGSSFGTLILDDGSGWRRIDKGEPRGAELSAIGRHRDGFLYTTRFGRFGEYRPGFGLCPELQAQVTKTRFIVSLKNGTVVLFGEKRNLVERNTVATYQVVR